MKLASYHQSGGIRLGALCSDQHRLLDLAAASLALRDQVEPAFASMLALIEAGPAALDRARAILEQSEDEHPGHCFQPLSGLRFAPPLLPPRMLCFSVYEGHMKQAFASVLEMKAGKGVAATVKALGLMKKMPKRFYQRPLYYKGNNLSVSAHEQDVIWPRWTKMLDYEMELGVVLGKRGKNISANDAMSYVFGYTCFNDFSARDKMMEEIPWGGVGPIKGKDFDTGNAMGPWLVTADEIPDPYDLKIQVRVNGELRGASSTSGMSHPISRMIEVASDEELVVPGEFFGTGAATNGCGIEFLRFLEPGDLVEVEIERIGVLRNRVVKPA
ncbi:MAG: fumarylacetoacetate hydrolase family protein [Stagnimonas sp.]|nr:fumarylacetoacetate hydrolase family protein [Stagnimonas sp.]